MGTSPEVKVNLAHLCMEGSTIHYFNSLLHLDPGLTWEKLTNELLERYGTANRGDVFEQLSDLQQRGTIDEYVQEFERLLSQAPNLPDEQYFGYFIHGLREDIRARVRSMRALTSLPRSRLIPLAKAIETELHGPVRSSVGSKGGGMRSGYGPGSFTRAAHQVSSGTGPPGRDSPPGWIMVKNDKGDRREEKGNPRPQPRDKGVRHLPYQELLDRRQKGLCFKCGGKYHPLHQCPDKQIRIMLLEEGDDVGEAGELSAETEDEDDAAVDGACSIMRLSSEPIQGQTMKLQGSILGVPILILVDSGATHNFISKRVVETMGWATQATPTMRILLGDGSKTTASGKCEQVSLEIANYKTTVEAILFDLDGIDLVLGIAWLVTLGDMLINWGKQTVRFQQEGRWFHFQGQGGSRDDHGALQSFLHQDIRTPEGYFMSSVLESQISKSQNRNVEQLTEKQSQQLTSLLEKFVDVFTAPRGLPPKRQREHQINLVAGHGPVNVRPYRYSHHHKDEIEKQVQELLQQGIIRHSQSAFSSPVILVKKKDGSWRMCVDYRELNKATIPDKFPIPVIDELLDELYGARFFSKLDLKSGYHQVLVREEDVPKTAFRTHEGHYEYLVMPFGLMNAPSTFQALMNEVFRDLLRRNVLVFFDDILVYSSDWETHLQQLTMVLDRLRKQGLVANRKKCSFAQQSVEYLGHVVSFQGVSMDPSKIQSVINWPTPKNVKGVR
ncbi:uncharacterized protein LOC130722592 [Lotus japonicus]|uniref:uncharacterized protein LOC130722592 n=1 Tax=Lotus japonicus TaxID=34305 RepID=UPI002586A2B1|nr:uncharacterized protein LOC130722592 [Lotus japonicus]XP_057429345.1 uncharacterized protein LOC130722592 [Lotus japonicus]XP_057429346.1 uncharacterized protein LOC130722592 [Lotus japonicus]XP_057429347.1 uncharacterized protein LOC130722592 [Lotus japonicus]XP_057429348.1 uncharacterized protein LOC130722592 [Lotus japonicus]XP_057429349.1 uncharacterized protein LOC130722592 [Lotus japonicus]XP_057429350.1 uncharacterized protein LOC130722592 [Lotus japonicus]